MTKLLRRPLRHLPIAALLLVLLLAACRRNELFMEYQPVNTSGWSTNDKLVFDLEPVAEEGDYVIYIEARTTEAHAYPYNDLSIEVRQLWSKDDDQQVDSIRRANDSVIVAHRNEISTDERLVSINNGKLGYDRRKKLKEEKDENYEAKRRASEARRAARHKDDPHYLQRLKAEAEAKPRLTPADSIARVTDSLINVIDALQTSIWRMGIVNDSIDLDRAHRIATDTVTFRFSDTDDRATGIAVRQFRVPLCSVHLLKGQSARLTIRHIMRLEAVPGLSDIGVSIAPEQP